MPWASTKDLPAGVRSSLPAEAQEVFRTVANSVKEKGGSDESAMRRAWGAVKRSYKKNKDGDWVKKEAEKLVKTITIRQRIEDDDVVEYRDSVIQVN